MSVHRSLQNTQEWMQNALTHPRSALKEDVDTRLKSSSRLSATERLAIYQRSYISRLRLCLAEQFPASRNALGADLFDQFARVYLASEPSDSYTLHELGRRFPAFLQATRPDRDTPEDRQEAWANFMVDLASYERTLFILFDAPGHEGKAWPTAATPDSALVLQPCFHIGAYRFPVANYYHSVSDQSKPRLPPRKESYVAITRYDYITSSYPLTKVHYLFLQALQRTGNVAAALDHVANTLDMSTEKVATAWTQQIRRQWIANHFFVERDFQDA